MTEQPEPIVSIDLGDDDLFVLHTIEDLSNWTENYFKRWEWVQELTSRNEPPASQAATDIWNFIGSARKFQKQLESSPTNANIRTQLTNLFKNAWQKGWQPEHSEKIQYVFHQKEDKGARSALMALAYFRNINYQPSQLNRESLTALLDVYVFDKKLSLITPSTKAALTKSVTSTENELSALREQRAEHDEQWSEQLSEITNTLGKHDKNLQELHDTREERLDQFLQNVESEIEAFKKAHREEINLKEPVTFWAKKQETSFWTSIVFGVLFVFGLIAVGAILVKESQTIYEGLKLGDSIEYWRVAGMILLGGLAFWFLRILSKIFLSQLHAWSDAQERVVMVKTYLSLLQDDKALDGNDRRLVLEALFRPSPTGIIKDDGVPPALFDAISRLK